jgi:GNAT superfamily N-acetyltransferase
MIYLTLHNFMQCFCFRPTLFLFNDLCVKIKYKGVDKYTCIAGVSMTEKRRKLSNQQTSLMNIVTKVKEADIPLTSALTETELEVLTLFTEGSTYKEIAEHFEKTTAWVSNVLIGNVSVHTKLRKRLAYVSSRKTPSNRKSRQTKGEIISELKALNHNLLFQVLSSLEIGTLRGIMLKAEVLTKSTFREIQPEEAISFVTKNISAKDRKFYSVSLEYFSSENVSPYGYFADGELAAIGCLSYYPYAENSDFVTKLGLSKLQSKRLLRIEATFVAPDRRGMGLQRVMLDERIQVAKKTGYRHLCISVHPENISNIRALAKSDFELVGEIENESGEPRLLYKKYLFQKEG